MGRIDGVTATAYVYRHYSYMKYCPVFGVNMKICPYNFKQKSHKCRVQKNDAKVVKNFNLKKSTKTEQCQLNEKNITVYIMGAK